MVGSTGEVERRGRAGGGLGALVAAVVIAGSIGGAAAALADHDIVTQERAVGGPGPALVLTNQKTGAVLSGLATTTLPPSATVPDLAAVLPVAPAGSKPLPEESGPADAARRSRSSSDPARARASLDLAGYTRGHDVAWSVPAGRTRRVTLIHLSEFAGDDAARSYTTANVGRTSLPSAADVAVPVPGALGVTYSKTEASGALHVVRVVARRGRLSVFVEVYGFDELTAADAAPVLQDALGRIDAVVPGLPS